jgi:hypothetical protein
MIDKVQMVVDIHRANKDLLGILNRLMGAEHGTEESEALFAVSNAVAILEEYLYPESRWSDDEKYIDDVGD